MNTELFGKGVLILGVIIFVVSLIMYPVSIIPGSSINPLEATSFQTMQQLTTASENISFPQEYYVETSSLNLATQSTDKPIYVLTYKHGSRYEKSYTFKETLTKQEYVSFAKNEDIIGIWDVPTILFQKPNLMETTTYQYGTMSDALQSTNTVTAVNQGDNGDNTIIVVIDAFPSESTFYDYIPNQWKNRIIHYPTDTMNHAHGIMTAGIAGYVSPNAKLYLISSNQDPISNFEKIKQLKNQYPNHNIICSNSYVFTGTCYYDSNHPVNRKILETANENIIVLFGAGNWAKENEHTPQWTLDVGYDSRNYMFERDSQIGYPAVFDEVISVAGCNAYGNKIVSYSSLGRGVDNNDEPDVSAPTHHYYENSPYNQLTIGTSASTPFMAGIIANVLTNKDADTNRMVGTIHQTSLDKGKSGFDEEFGYGIADTIKIINIYDSWIPIPKNESNIFYILSISLIVIGGILYKKNDIVNVIGG
ncbi:MAG: S8 family serine peptidase [Candidatus Thermoplasmatota archaeon]|nr:S8 family serine peptidase [Candidatus Thermoplasmatota archaeon]